MNQSPQQDPPDSGSSQPAAAQPAAVRASGDRTIGQYQQWMETNAAAHMMRAARQSGITQKLRERQHTLDELCESLSLDRTTLGLLLGGLVSIGFVEQYGDDFTLARAGHLLCQYDEDLGDSRWETLGGRLQTSGDSDSDAAIDDNDYRQRLAATQWIHTSAAMQAAEILDIGGDATGPGLHILDLGCGSAVWSCAMAHRDAQATVVGVDQAAALAAAKTLAESIELGDRFKSIESDPLLATVGSNQFDLVVLAQLLSSYGDTQAVELIGKSVAALKSGGRLVAPDFYIGPGKAGLTETTSRLAIHLATRDGRVRDLRQSQQMFQDAGLQSIQFTYLAASEAGLGMIVAEKP
ncbi:methyltransferase domain-containing protein [Stieleria sp. TO1_6]|uniref:class I SAM-dependent methyltransferase n=1 Tax=Stieleria tagensis TaxID=2956795 RepID=UPI00209AB774|nr:class I SAM-dependent methyltransferase [Stieleria tagensis]MCO8120777.1 methyltransferase domain-containing protein [Stieleria tagensis]